MCLLVIQKGHLRVAWRICNTMVRRGNGRQAAKVSGCLVAAGHEDFKSCLTGELGDPNNLCVATMFGCISW